MVRLIGFDTEGQNQESYTAIDDYIQKKFSSKADGWSKKLTSCISSTTPAIADPFVQYAWGMNNQQKVLSKTANQTCLQGISEIRQSLGTFDPQNSDQSQIHIALDSLESFHNRIAALGWAKMNNSQSQYLESLYFRNFGMANLLTKHVSIAQNKASNGVIVWAHNMHLDKSDKKDMGSYLLKKFGSTYLSVALIAYKTDVDWPEMQLTQPIIAPSNSLEYYLAKQKFPPVLIDLRSNGILTKGQPTPIAFTAGEANSPGNVGSEHFDMLYYQNTSLARIKPKGL